MDSHSLHHTILCISILFLLPIRWHRSVVTTFVAGNGVVLLLENRHSSFYSNNHDGRTVHHKLLEKGVGLQADNPSIHSIDGSILPAIPQSSIHDPVNACVYLATQLSIIRDARGPRSKTCKPSLF